MAPTASMAPTARRLQAFLGDPLNYDACGACRLGQAPNPNPNPLTLTQYLAQLNRETFL